MGFEYMARCKKCKKTFTVQEGGGFQFHQLRCDKCGRNKFIDFKDIGEPHLRYLKGLSVPYSIATAEHDRYVQENYPGESLTEEDYYRIVETMAGKHRCGGYFKFNAPVRCGNCRSTEIEATEDDHKVCYD